MVDAGRGDASFESSLLSWIAKEVNTEGRQAVLQKDLVLDILDEVKSEKSSWLFLSRILNLFQDKDEISIVGKNKTPGLEELLNALAEIASNETYRCNQKVVVPQL
ncbi:hypothetical protein BGZ83_008151 [Gryganskiella cystojenkinii]|nr:hypothetical protein BGZ83_008151 [Gryganskiella cystojenkinii]